MYKINYKYEYEIHKEKNSSGTLSTDYETREEALYYAIKEAGSSRYTALKDNRADKYFKPKLIKTDDGVYFVICVGKDYDLCKVSYYVTEHSLIPTGKPVGLSNNP